MNNTDHDSLIQEVEEDLARKRMEAAWKKYGPYVVGGALLIVLATAGVTGWRNYKTTSEQTMTQALVDVVIKPDSKAEERRTALEAFATAHQGKDAAHLAKFIAAATALEQDKRAEALVIYDALAKDTSVDDIYRQLADLFAVQVQMDDGDIKTLQARLEPLMKENSAWRFSATEFAAYLALREGDKEKAKALFTELRTKPNVPSTITARANDVLQWLGKGN